MYLKFYLGEDGKRVYTLQVWIPQYLEQGALWSVHFNCPTSAVFSRGPLFKGAYSTQEKIQSHLAVNSNSVAALETTQYVLYHKLF